MAKNLEVSMLYDFYGAVLTEKQRDVIELYYNEDLSLAEISQNEGITRQGVRDAIKRAEQQMFEMEAQLGLVKRFRQIEKQLNEVSAAAQRIAACNARYCGPSEISEQAEKILVLAQQLKE
ncbi:MAG: YlxM family DNA-binding protein [Firmicutes bacterium]|nr:YlxM family DNA-binding protein [Bacillota bacterium]